MNAPDHSKIMPGRVPPATRAEGSPGTEPAKALTADEQMDLYEQHLKENDWGHQPC